MASKADTRLPTVRDRDLVRFSRALAEVSAPGLDAANYAERAFRLLSHLVPNELSAVGACTPADGQLTASFNQHLAGMEATFAAFGALMHRHAPFRFDPAVHGGRPYSMPDCYGRRQFHDLDIYQEVHRPMGFTDHGFVHVPSADGTVVFFGLFRAGGDFSVREKELLTLAQPHLANLRQLAAALTAARGLPLEPGLFEPLGLTPRECEVVYWLTQGKTNLEVALLLRVRADTVSGHLRAIYEKLLVENRVAATLVALERPRGVAARPPAGRGAGGGDLPSADRPARAVAPTWRGRNSRWSREGCTPSLEGYTTAVQFDSLRGFPTFLANPFCHERPPSRLRHPLAGARRPACRTVPARDRAPRLRADAVARAGRRPPGGAPRFRGLPAGLRSLECG